MQFGLVFRSERRQMGVGREIRGGANRRQERKQNLCVAISWMDDADVRPIEPNTDVRTGSCRCERTIEDLPVGRDPDESKNGNPCETNLVLAVQEILPPAASLGMDDRLAVVRVDEEVDVGNDHERSFLAAASESSSSTSWLIRSRSTPGLKPKA